MPSSRRTSSSPAAASSALVLARRREAEPADRRAHVQLLARDEARDDDRIGEEHDAARLQHAPPVGEHGRAVGEVVDRVDAGDRVEARVVEGERLARVGLLEAGERRSPCGARGCGDRVGVEVDADDRRARVADELECRPARAAGDVEHRRARPDAEPARQRAPVGEVEPARLPDVAVVGLAAHLRVDARRGAVVGGVEEQPAEARLGHGRGRHGRTSKTEWNRVVGGAAEAGEAGGLGQLADARLAGLGAERERALLRERARRGEQRREAVVGAAERREVVLDAVAGGGLDDQPRPVAVEPLVHVARGAGRVAHVVQAVEHRHQVVLAAGEGGGVRGLEAHAPGHARLLGAPPRGRDRRDVVVGAREGRAGEGPRHQDRRPALAAAGVGHAPAALELADDAVERRQPRPDEARRVRGAGEAVAAVVDVAAVLVPGDAVAGAHRLRDERRVDDRAERELEEAGEERGAVRVGEHGGLLGREAVAAAAGVVRQVAARRLRVQPLAHVRLGRARARRQLGGDQRPRCGQRPVEPEPVADHDQSGVQRRADLVDRREHELLQLLRVERGLCDRCHRCLLSGSSESGFDGGPETALPHRAEIPISRWPPTYLRARVAILAACRRSWGAPSWGGCWRWNSSARRCRRRSPEAARPCSSPARPGSGRAASRPSSRRGRARTASRCSSAAASTSSARSCRTSRSSTRCGRTVSARAGAAGSQAARLRGDALAARPAR